MLYLAGNAVYKVGSAAAMEAGFMKQLAGCRPCVCPVILAADDTAFSMEFGQDSRNVEDLDIAELSRDLYWAIFQLHECNVVHSDIKPSNVVLLDDVYCLIDFDAAVSLNSGALERRRSTEAFSSSDLFAESDCKDWDLVGMLGTVTFFTARAQAGKSWRSSEWGVRTRDCWGLKMVADRTSVLRSAGVVPDGQLGSRLVHPREHMKAYCKLKRGDEDVESWIQHVRKLELEKRWFACPKQILEQYFKIDSV
jgi:hypothetical protein